jgi:hypothetical protein
VQQIMANRPENQIDKVFRTSLVEDPFTMGKDGFGTQKKYISNLLHAFTPAKHDKDLFFSV